MSRKLPKIIEQGTGAYAREKCPRGFHPERDPRPRLGCVEPEPLFVRNGYTAQICDGEAHSNAMIDNCPCCAPMWGVMVVANKFAKVNK